jgi:hypothetical protein
MCGWLPLAASYAVAQVPKSPEPEAKNYKLPTKAPIRREPSMLLMALLMRLR